MATWCGRHFFPYSVVAYQYMMFTCDFLVSQTKNFDPRTYSQSHWTCKRRQGVLYESDTLNRSGGALSIQITTRYQTSVVRTESSKPEGVDRKTSSCACSFNKFSTEFFLMTHTSAEAAASARAGVSRGWKRPVFSPVLLLSRKTELHMTLFPIISHTVVSSLSLS